MTQDGRQRKDSSRKNFMRGATKTKKHGRGRQEEFAWFIAVDTFASNTGAMLQYHINPPKKQSNGHEK